MPNERCRQILIELVDWLVSIERLAHDVYKATADTLRADAHVSRFVASLADDEAQHAELMASIQDAVAKQESTPPPEIRLDATLREIVETPLRRLQAGVATGTITRKCAIALIAEVEFTEWNEIFLYVLGTFGAQGREMEAVLATIQEHERRIESFINGFPSDVRSDLDVAKLAKIWDVHLLLVDDNRLIRELLVGLLKSIGRVTAVENGEQALEATRRHFFDAVVSDLRMPVMGGLDFYDKAVAEHTDLKNRFVFVSFDPSKADVKYLDERRLPLLEKPFAPQELVEAVHRIASTAHSVNGTDEGSWL